MGSGKKGKILHLYPERGQTLCYDSSSNVIDCTDTGQDGDVQEGGPLPSPRFTYNGNGTVTDNLTKLVWLEYADRLGLRTWEDALDACNSLKDNKVDLTDGSVPGDWRLPNIRELLSLINYEYFCPCLSNTDGTDQFTDGNPFISLQAPSPGNEYYWSSTTLGSASGGVDFCTGELIMLGKGDLPHFVWPVRNARTHE